MVIDLLGLGVEDVRKHFPEVYQHVLTKVKPERDANKNPGPMQDGVERKGGHTTTTTSLEKTQ